MRRIYDRDLFWSRDIETVSAYLARLPSKISGVLRLHYLEHYPIVEIGSMIGKSLSMARNYHSRGLFLLNELLIKEGGEGPGTVSISHTP